MNYVTWSDLFAFLMFIATVIGLFHTWTKKK
mgnify:CR=1 FL=1